MTSWTNTLLYIITLANNWVWHKAHTNTYSLHFLPRCSGGVCVVCVCGYANASPGSQEKIKGDNSSSNSFLLRPSVMLTNVHILEKEMYVFLSVLKCLHVCVCVCVGTSMGKCMSAWLSCTVMCLTEWGEEEAEWRYQLYLTLEWSGLCWEGDWYTPLNNYFGEEETGSKRKNNAK